MTRSGLRARLRRLEDATLAVAAGADLVTLAAVAVGHRLTDGDRDRLIALIAKGAGIDDCLTDAERDEIWALIARAIHEGKNL